MAQTLHKLLKTLHKVRFYSFYRLLTHYNRFFWDNFPNHSYGSWNRHVSWKLTHFTCLRTRSTLLIVYCRILHKNTMILHRFNHVLIPKTQYNYLKNHKMNTNSTVIHVWTFSSKTDDPQVRISGWYEQEHKWLCFGKLILIVGEKENEGNEVKGHLLLMKSKAL